MEQQRIANLLYRSAELLERGALEEASELFAGASITLTDPMGQQEVVDAQGLLKLWQTYPLLSKSQSSRGAQCQYLITNPMIHIDRELRSATCRSNYMVLQLNGNTEIKEAGRYLDEFSLGDDGQWSWVAREQQLLSGGTRPVEQAAADADVVVGGEKLSPAKIKILDAAQQVFSTVGYSEASIRKIADVVGISPTILFRHFGTKANLFEQALVMAMGEPRQPEDRASFGLHVANILADPNQINCPHAMTILATGNEEAREIAIRVLRQYAVEPMMEWLGEENIESRAREIMALCAGFALYNSQLNVAEVKTVDQHMVDWLARSIQAVVDGH